MGESDDNEEQEIKTQIPGLEKLFRQEDIASKLNESFSVTSELNEALSSYQEIFQSITATGAMAELGRQSDLFNSPPLHNLTGAFGDISEELKLIQKQSGFSQLTGAFSDIEKNQLTQLEQVNDSLTAAVAAYDMMEETKFFQQELQLHNPELDFIQHGIVDSQGNPIKEENDEDEQIIKEIHSIEHELTERMKREPEKIKDLHWREFEQLIAEIMEKRGFKTELTPRSNDGGVDVIAVEKNDLGSFMYLVQCKRIDDTRSVGPGVVRKLFGVVSERDATRGIVATSSDFDPGAKDTAEQYPYRMSLKNYRGIKEWLEKL